MDIFLTGFVAFTLTQAIISITQERLTGFDIDLKYLFSIRQYLTW